jgi:Fe-S-cluster containining protein
MENIISSKICKKCAKCCRNYPFIKLSQNEINEIEKLTKLPLDVFADRKDEAGEEYFLKFKENGDCFFLTENDGSYSCDIYEARSEICRNYPSNPEQDKVCYLNKKMILLNHSG